MERVLVVAVVAAAVIATAASTGPAGERRPQPSAVQEAGCGLVPSPGPDGTCAPPSRDLRSMARPA